MVKGGGMIQYWQWLGGSGPRTRLYLDVVGGEDLAGGNEVPNLVGVVDLGTAAEP